MRAILFSLCFAIVSASVASAAEPRATAFTFHRLGPKVGQQSRQRVDYNLALDVTWNEGGLPRRKSKQTLGRLQLRRVTILATKFGMATKAKITFEQAQQTSSADNSPAESENQLVAGKTYIVERTGEALIITDEKGKSPPLLEQRTVAASMESLGRKNPIAMLLDGKTITTGQTVPVPDSVAKELFAFIESVRDVKPFELTLTRGEIRQGRQVAIFAARIEGSSPLAQNTFMRLSGELAIDVNTCRVLETEFRGPVSMAQTSFSPEGINKTVIGNGRLQIVSTTQPVSSKLANRSTPTRR